MRRTHLDRAIGQIGSARKLACCLGVTAMAVSQWRSRGVPPARAKEIEQLTQKQVTRYQLRPDIFSEEESQIAA